MPRSSGQFFVRERKRNSCLNLSAVMACGKIKQEAGQSLAYRFRRLRTDRFHPTVAPRATDFTVLAEENSSALDNLLLCNLRFNHKTAPLGRVANRRHFRKVLLTSTAVL